MIATRQRRRRRTTRRRPEPRRLRRRAGLAIAAVLTVGLAFATYHSGSSSGPAEGVAAVSSSTLAADGRPKIEPLATYGPSGPSALQLNVPIRQQRITAVVYHGIGTAGVVPLQPAGHQVNAGFLSRVSDRLFGGDSSPGPRYFIDDSSSGPDTGSVDVGAPAGTTVYAPVDGVIVSVRPFELSGKQWGSTIQIRPDRAAAITVTVRALRLPKSSPLQVGDPVTASRTPLGKVVDLSGVLDQTVAKYTADAGNHVSLSLGPSPGASPLL